MQIVSWRPLHILLLVVAVLSLLDFSLYIATEQRRAALVSDGRLFDVITSSLGLTDICVSTEARYTRHPAVSDPLAPFMDHPGAIEHFPTGSFWVPPASVLRPEGN